MAQQALETLEAVIDIAMVFEAYHTSIKYAAAHLPVFKVRKEDPNRVAPMEIN